MAPRSWPTLFLHCAVVNIIHYTSVVYNVIIRTSGLDAIIDHCISLATEDSTSPLYRIHRLALGCVCVSRELWGIRLVAAAGPARLLRWVLDLSLALSL